MGLNVTSWAGTFLFYIQNLLAVQEEEIINESKSGLELFIDFDNPKGAFVVDMESLTLKT